MIPVIFGCEGPALTAWETAFFRERKPIGFILFRRNCDSSDQIRALCAEMRDVVGDPDLPILIDQEGGRVARLAPPEWRASPPAAPFGALYARDRAAAREAVRLNALLLADELIGLGINVDCVPVLDVPVPGAHDIVGDRAFAADPAIVADLGRVMAAAMLEGGVQPVIKHIPGHGRAGADSHLALPRVDASRATLSASDFLPFRACRDMPWGMTAHILYTDIDPDRPATLSETVVDGVIRGEIGFDGVLMTDDLSMAALTGDYGDRTRASLAAGCDVALHCNGHPAQMEAIADGAGEVCAAAGARLARARGAAARHPASLDRPWAEARVAALLAGDLTSMGENSSELLINILIVAIPVIIAITFHEAAHGFVAWAFGDPTAHAQGRVTFNPLKHVDLVGTIILPAALLLARAPFLFGWAKPVPIDPSRLGNPRRDMIFVAAAGPGINLALAFVSGVLLALAGPSGAEPDFIHRALSVSVYINAILAVFNMIPLPPLDGGRVAVGLLPGPLAYRLLKIEPFGIFIVIGVLILLPWISRELGHEINPFADVVYPVILAVVDVVENVTGADVVQAWL